MFREVQASSYDDEGGFLLFNQKLTFLKIVSVTLCLCPRNRSRLKSTKERYGDIFYS